MSQVGHHFEVACRQAYDRECDPLNPAVGLAATLDEDELQRVALRDPQALFKALFWPEAPANRRYGYWRS